MATGDDDADRFRVPRWIADSKSEDGEFAERPPTTEDERSLPYDRDAYIPRAETPPLAVGEPLWPTHERSALPPPVTRGQREAAEPQRRGLIIVAVAAAVVVIVAAGLLIWRTGGHDNKTPAAVSGQSTPEAPTGPANGPASGPTGPATGPATGAPALPPGPPSNATPTTRAPTTAGPTFSFGPLAIEAEAPGNTLVGSARITEYPNASGGRVVRNIGDWGLDAGPGTLRFNNVDVPRTGNYTLAFSYVDLDNEANRTAVIDISGRTGVVITVNGSDTCCRTQTVQVPLRKGKNTISFGNLTSHAPSIDKIVITAP